MKSGVYWGIAVALIAFGGLAIFSIGAPFLLMGLMLVVFSPWRERSGVLLTGVAVVTGFALGYILVVPLRCTHSTMLDVNGAIARESVRCTNLLGIRYEGGGNYDPSLLPALLVGIAAATLAGVVGAMVARRPRRTVPERPDASGPPDPRTVARSIIDSNTYMTLATADGAGHPWVSPVWYAHRDYREFYWVSSPDASHSRNVAVRPELAIVIFDSHEAGGWKAVYLSATAEQLDDLDEGVAIFSRRSVEKGLPAWTRDKVREPAKHRLYRATATEHFVLDPHDERIPVDPT